MSYPEFNEGSEYGEVNGTFLQKITTLIDALLEVDPELSIKMLRNYDSGFEYIHGGFTLDDFYYDPALPETEFEAEMQAHKANFILRTQAEGRYRVMCKILGTYFIESLIIIDYLRGKTLHETAEYAYTAFPIGDDTFARLEKVTLSGVNGDNIAELYVLDRVDEQIIKRYLCFSYNREVIKISQKSIPNLPDDPLNRALDLFSDDPARIIELFVNSYDEATINSLIDEIRKDYQGTPMEDDVNQVLDEVQEFLTARRESNAFAEQLGLNELPSVTDLIEMIKILEDHKN